MDEPNSAVKNLQAVLEEERRRREEAEKTAKALMEEFSGCGDFDEVRKKFKEQIKLFAPQALSNIISLANGAQSESVQASMNKWIVEWSMSDKIDASGSDLTELLKNLQKQPTGPSDGS